MILSEEQIDGILKKNAKKTPNWIMTAREYRDTLFALIEGEDFDKLLEKVEHIEGTKKAIARRKYARNVKDMFERLLRMTDNVYSATGGVKRYVNLSDSEKETLVESLSNVRGGESLESWLENNWKQLYHLDPNGIIFLEYMEGVDPYPTYKSIKSIRNYLQNGQKLEWLLFEPVELEDGLREWRLVDDLMDYTIIQNGEVFHY